MKMTANRTITGVSTALLDIAYPSNPALEFH